MIVYSEELASSLTVAMTRCASGSAVTPSVLPAMSHWPMTWPAAVLHDGAVEIAALAGLALGTDAVLEADEDVRPETGDVVGVAQGLRAHCRGAGSGKGVREEVAREDRPRREGCLLATPSLAVGSRRRCRGQGSSWYQRDCQQRTSTAPKRAAKLPTERNRMMASRRDALNSNLGPPNDTPLSAG